MTGLIYAPAFLTRRADGPRERELIINRRAANELA